MIDRGDLTSMIAYEARKTRKTINMAKADFSRGLGRYGVSRLLVGRFDSFTWKRILLHHHFFSLEKNHPIRRYMSMLSITLSAEPPTFYCIYNISHHTEGHAY